jgi:hypothetical protein
MLDPIFERQSKIAKVIDEPFTCYKKGKKAVKQTTIDFFPLKLFKIPILVHENGKKGTLSI